MPNIEFMDSGKNVTVKISLYLEIHLDWYTGLHVDLCVFTGKYRGKVKKYCNLTIIEVLANGYLQSKNLSRLIYLTSV